MIRTEVHPEERVAVMTLDDPERRNAMNLTMVGEIVDAFDHLEADDSVGAVVVTGAPPAFCAGADLGNLAQATPNGLKSIYEGFMRVGRSSLATVAAVNGAAVGAGVNLALSCDLRLAAPEARFVTRFLDLGLHPGGGHTWMLRNLAGPQAAAAMVLFGQAMTGEEAEQAGLVWRCYDAESLIEEAVKIAARASSGPKELVAEIKSTLAAMASVTSHDAAVERELAPQVWSTGQPWFAERLAALQARVSSRNQADG